MSEAAPASVPPPAGAIPARASFNDWLAVVAGMLGALMALVDVSIVNASLPVIQGEIGATPSESTWVGTSYLIAEIVVIPLTAWLERLFGMRRLLLVAVFLFTLFSMVCGMANSLQTLILGRIGQGLAGGVLIPAAMTIVARRLPPNQQPIGLALIAMTALIGPATGPLLGGWLTDTFSWSLIFLLNVPVGVLQLVLITLAFPRVKGDWHELRNADWLGIAGMVLGLGAFTLLLEEGHREQWFESNLIRALALLSVIGVAMVALGQLSKKGRPVIRLALLRIPSLASVVALMGMVGLLLFTALYVTPQFLATIAGYNASQAGQVVFVAGAISIPVAFTFPFLVRLVDVRVLVGVAIVLLVAANLMLTDLTVQSVGSAFLVTQLLYGTGTTLAAMPLQQVALSSVPPDDAAEANSLMAVARNLGGSVGLAAVASFQEQRFDVHRWQIHSSLAASDPEVQRHIGESAAVLGGGPAGIEAAARALDGQVTMQALAMTFNDVFLVMGLVGLLVLPAVILMRPPPAGMAMAMGH